MVSLERVRYVEVEKMKKASFVQIFRAQIQTSHWGNIYWYNERCNPPRERDAAQEREMSGTAASRDAGDTGPRGELSGRISLNLQAVNSPGRLRRFCLVIGDESLAGGLATARLSVDLLQMPSDPLHVLIFQL
jgi:hypothetical protein